MNYQQATFNLDYDTLRQIMGLPDGVSIVRVHSMPGQFAGRDGLRFVLQAAEFPVSKEGDEIPVVVPCFKVAGPTYREFTGFKVGQIVQVGESHIEDDL